MEPIIDFDTCFLILAVPVIAVAIFFAFVTYTRETDRLSREAEESWRRIKAPPAADEPVPGRDDQLEPSVDESQVIKPPHDYFGPGLALLVVLLSYNVSSWSLPFLVLALLAGLTLSYRSTRGAHRLAKHGEITLGTVTDLEIPQRPWLRSRSIFRPKDKAILTYRFQVQDQPEKVYEGTFEVGEKRRLAMVVGTQVKVKYLPADPRISTLETG